MIIISSLIGYRYSINTYIPLLCISSLITILIMANIYILQKSKYYELTLFYEIFLFMVAIMSIIKVTVSFYGLDSQIDFATLQIIVNHGYNLSNVPIYFLYQYMYPMLYMYTIISSLICNQSLYTIAQYVPMTFVIITSLFAYKIFTNMNLSKKTAMLAMFGFSMIYTNLIFHSSYTEESYAFVLFIAILYIITLKNYNITFSFINILLLLTITLSHHLTAFILLLFLILISIYATLFYKTYIKRIYGITATLFVLIMMQWMYFYGIYFYTAPWVIVVSFIKLLFASHNSSFSTTVVSSIPDTLRYLILKYSAVVIGFSFGLLSIISFYINKNKNVFHISFITFGCMCGVIAFACLIGAVGINMGPERFLDYGYLSLFLISGYLLDLKSLKYKYLKLFIVVLFFSMIIINIYEIDPTLYSNTTAQYFNGEYKTYASTSEYNALIWLNSSSNNSTIIYATTYRIFGTFLPSNIKGVPEGDYFSNYSYNINKSYNNYNIYLSDTTLPSTQIKVYNRFIYSSSFNKVYDDNKARIFIAK